MEVYRNRPNSIDVWLGYRVGNELYIDTEKQISNKSTEVIDAGFLGRVMGKQTGSHFPIDTLQTTIHRKHRLWHSPLLIIDRQWASAILGIKQKYEAIDNRTEADLDKLEAEIKEANDNVKTKSRITLNINPIFKLSAIKLYKWIDQKVIDASYNAIVSNKVVKGSMLVWLIIGAMLGGTSAYAIVLDTGIGTPPPSHITQTVTTTLCQYSTYKTSTNVDISGTQTEITGLASSCLANYYPHTNSTLTSNSSSQVTHSTTSEIGTLVNRTLFNNGTIVNVYSNGTRITLTDTNTQSHS